MNSSKLIWLSLSRSSFWRSSRTRNPGKGQPTSRKRFPSSEAEMKPLPSTSGQNGADKRRNKERFNTLMFFIFCLTWPEKFLVFDPHIKSCSDSWECSSTTVCIIFIHLWWLFLSLCNCYSKIFCWLNRLSVSSDNHFYIHLSPVGLHTTPLKVFLESRSG